MVELDSEYALFELSPAVYTRIRELAIRYMRRERIGHTYRPTELANEALCRLLSSKVSFGSQRHFLITCARQMRHVLINHAKAKRRLKRGGTESLSTDLQESIFDANQCVLSIVEVDDLLTKLGLLDEEGSQVVDLCYFMGLTTSEASLVMEVSESTVTRKLRFARSWITKQLDNGRNQKTAK